MSLADLSAQATADLFAKEVQSSPTYSYQWMADQLGHIAIGYALFMIVEAAVQQFAPQQGWWLVWTWLLPIVVPALLVSLYELSTFIKEWRRSTGPINVAGHGLLAWNATTAAYYMIAGTLLAAIGDFGALWQRLLAIALLILVSVAIATWWLRQKIRWQRAALPFLFRVSEMPAKYFDPCDGWRAVQTFLLATRLPIPHDPPKKSHLLIMGALGAGKTDLVTGIGTECAFAGLKVRYTTLDKLLEIEAAGQEPGAARGLGIWSWRKCEVLLVDDVNVGVREIDQPRPADGTPPGTGKLEAAEPKIKSCARKRHTVWVVGYDPKQADAARQPLENEWSRTIAELLGIPAGELLLVHLKRPPDEPKAA